MSPGESASPDSQSHAPIQMSGLMMFSKGIGKIKIRRNPMGRVRFEHIKNLKKIKYINTGEGRAR